MKEIFLFFAVISTLIIFIFFNEEEPKKEEVVLDLNNLECLKENIPRIHTLVIKKKNWVIFTIKNHSFEIGYGGNYKKFFYSIKNGEKIIIEVCKN